MSERDCTAECIEAECVWYGCRHHPGELERRLGVGRRSPRRIPAAMLLVLAVALLGVLILALVSQLSPAPARSATPSTYTPVPAIAFAPLPMPAVPGIAPGAARRRVPAESAPPTIRPDVHATSPVRHVSGRISGANRLVGTASWYCDPGVSRCMAAHPSGGMFAAAGPALRAAIGPGWRNRVVHICLVGGACLVDGYGRPIGVVLADWCACGSGREIDLYSDVFDQLGPLGLGVLKVEVLW